jgi:hypothetical protein
MRDCSRCTYPIRSYTTPILRSRRLSRIACSASEIASSMPMDFRVNQLPATNRQPGQHPFLIPAHQARVSCDISHLRRSHVLNAYFRMGHDPGGFRVWWRALTESDETLENAYLMRLAGRFSRRTRGYAKAHGIPVASRIGSPVCRARSSALPSTD